MTSKIFIVGYYGFGNAGDDAIGLTTFREIQERYPNAEISVVSGGRNLFEEAIEVPFKVMDILRELYRCDTLVFTGGTHFHDRYSSFSHGLKVFLFYLFVVSISRLSGSRVHLLAHGFGPLENPLYQLITTIIISLSNTTTVRDPKSKEAVWSPLTPISVTFDIGALLDRSNHKSTSDETTLGISVTPAFKNTFGQPELDEALIEDIATAVDTLVKEGLIDEVRIYEFDRQKLCKGTDLGEDLLQALQTDEVMIVEYNDNPESFLEKVETSDRFLGMKYHSLVFAYLNNVPAMGISYHPKCEWFRDYAGYEDETTIRMENASASSLEAGLIELCEDSTKFTPSLSTENAVELATHNFEVLNDC